MYLNADLDTKNRTNREFWKIIRKEKPSFKIQFTLESNYKHIMFLCLYFMELFFTSWHAKMTSYNKSIYINHDIK